MPTPDHATVFQSELTAVEHGVDKANDLGIRGKVSLHSDSLSSIQALQKQDVLSLQCYRTHLAVKRFSAKADLRIHWIKAHVGHPGNERADELAKAGLQSDNFSDVGMSLRHCKLLFREASCKEWDWEWDGLSTDPNRTCKQTKIWWPGVNETQAKKSNTLIQMDREDLSPSSQWYSGFNSLKYHKHKKSGTDPTCRLCHEGLETSDHLAFHCPRTLRARVDNFHVHDGMPRDWNPHSVLKFIRYIESLNLLIDEEEY